MVDKQTLFAPVAGELTRIPMNPGDLVSAGQAVAEILPAAPQLLDARSRSEMAARLGAAKAGLDEARRNAERAEIALELAISEAALARKLHSTQSAPARAVELAEAEERTRRAELSLARTTVERARLEARAVATYLGEGDTAKAGGDGRVEVHAPGSGVVLRVHARSAGPVQPGAPLMEIGSPANLELIVDLPTQSAVKVIEGAAVRIDGVGNEVELRGIVRLVEPGAFTKVTALGVEEQRVNVVVAPAGDLGGWVKLGDGFAADAHIEVYEATDVIKVPGGAVFREGDGYAAFLLAGGEAHRTPVEIGARSADEIEITAGLKAGDTVVVHPSDKLQDGSAVAVE